MEKKPFITLEQARDIIKDIPTPFHLYDEKGIRENARELYKAFSWNKGYKEFFSFFSTPNPYIMQILKEEGCGMDCSSYTELQLCEACGISGSDIMFSSNVTPVQDMKLAYDMGAYINLDDYTHVEFIKKVCGVPKTICCRFNPGGVFKMADSEDKVQVMDTPGDSKYGMTEEQMEKAFIELKEAGAEEFGIHAFLASNTVSNGYYPELAGILFNLAVRLQKKTGVHIKFINLSGGVGVDYKPEEQKNDIAVIGEGVHKKFDEILVPNGMGDVAVYTELGRYMLAPYGAKYDVTGGLCENNDKFAVDRMLPKIDKGDIIYIHDAGAHGFSMGYNYNGKLRSAEVLLREDGSHKLIRRAEEPKDYFATFDFGEYGKLSN